MALKLAPDIVKKMRALYFEGKTVQRIAFELGCEVASVMTKYRKQQLSRVKDEALIPDSLTPEYIAALKALYPHYRLLELAQCLNRRSRYVAASIKYLIAQHVIAKCSVPGPPQGWSRREYDWLLENAAHFNLEDIALELKKSVPAVGVLLFHRGLLSKDQLIAELVEASEPAGEQLVDKTIHNQALVNFPSGWTDQEYDWFITHVSLMRPFELAMHLKKPLSELQSAVKFTGNTKPFRKKSISTLLAQALELRPSHTITEISKKLGKRPQYILTLFSRYDEINFPQSNLIFKQWSVSVL